MGVAKKAIMQAMVEGVVTELMVKTQTDNVYVDDTTTLSAKLAEIVTAINLRAKSTDVTSEISAAIDELIGGAPSTYDTLKEISDYIAAHPSVAESLNEAIGKKADKEAFDAVKTTVDALGSLASKSKVSETDLDDTLKAKINGASTGSHTHDNKEALDTITDAKITAWDSKSIVHVSANQPTNFTNKDLWFQIIE